jgi:DnaA-homolog protein
VIDPKQLPLGIDLRDDRTLETYFPGENQQALMQIKQIARGEGEPFVYLWGREGVGRTHLLQGACHWANRYQQTSFYLSFSAINDFDPSILEGLERLDLICLDDLESIVGSKVWEEAVFHLFNRLRSQNRRLLIAANHPPKGLAITLADLASRLSWGVVYLLQPLSDNDLLLALQLRAKERGLLLSDEVGAFLIRRCTRSMPELYGLLETLDKASLVAQRRLTIPFVKVVLAL